MSDDVLVAYLLDRSGSMGSIKGDVIGGFNAFLEDQKAQEGSLRFILTLFDTEGIDTTDQSIAEVPSFTADTYQPRAGTPLLDAVGKTINHVLDLETEFDKILFVIHTDGQENSSREYSREAVQKLVKECQDDRNWEFIYLGVDVDAFHEAGMLGVPMDHTISTNAGQTHQVLMAASGAINSSRTGQATNYDALNKVQEENTAGSKT